MGPARLICIMGSGETAPTMVSVHQDLMERVGSPPGAAVILDTPYGFEENADEISAKATNYFAVNVGRAAGVTSVRDFAATAPDAVERMFNAVRAAQYVFAGPGSPSYAVRQWGGTILPELLRGRVLGGGCVTFASAAATTLGRVTLPVYEIYKVGERPHWIEGLNVLAAARLDVAVVPHYDNTQGGTHDTRYCFMGLRRLQQLQAQLPEDVTILGVAEHTAAVIDVDADTLTVLGRGFVAGRRGDEEDLFATGDVVPLERFRGPGAVVRRTPTPPGETAVGGAGESFDAALGRGDAAAAARIALELEERLATDPGAGARSELRGMLVRLADAAQTGLEPRRERVAPFVELALRLRDSARRGGRYADADAVRDELGALGVEVRDTPEGTEWDIS